MELARLTTLLNGAILDGARLVGAGDGDGEVDVTGVAHDSRAVAPGDLFCCVRGEHADGHDHAAAAVGAGAVALLCERRLDLPIPQVVVPDARAAMGPAAAAVHGNPSEHLVVIGVTGTNGKTTTVHLLSSILEHAGRRAEVIGTLTGARTTPEAPELQRRFADFLAAGVEAVAMEVSSHALALHRVDGTRFRAAVFTNLSAEHLDFHATMEEYFQAKARLFTPELADAAVVNVDDPRGRLLRDAAIIPTRGFSLDEVDDLEVGHTSSRFRWRDQHVTVPLGGRFNVANALAAAETAITLGIEPAVAAEGLATAGPVPGRFEAVDAGQDFGVVVDYAHTPDGLERLLDTARELVGEGRLLLVFGCGGDRDTAKRPLMGEVAGRLADQVVLTSDNPRSEDPATIISEVRSGFDDDRTLLVEPDRRRAIAMALETADPGDLVVIAGKGHETTQTIGETTLPFDDRVVARELLS
ncbi:MAG: UDP-N-acetylmuramoyl-L-alanyl-D-glutamate--2,6-diaminopimelate ligase [Acidimicrobiales bacterium]|nr:UDP-N-acetylmuramoyl-L-alanyl-D-glutamate--2,6-diaminopimelate ligase [Acidimicrobiales bacterium]